MIQIMETFKDYYVHYTSLQKVTYECKMMIRVKASKTVNEYKADLHKCSFMFSESNQYYIRIEFFCQKVFENVDKNPSLDLFRCLFVHSN